MKETFYKLLEEYIALVKIQEDLVSRGLFLDRKITDKCKQKLDLIFEGFHKV
jgi:hypothetical protein